MSRLIPIQPDPPDLTKDVNQMDILVGLGAVVAAFAAAVLAWPVDRPPIRPERYRIYGR